MLLLNLESLLAYVIKNNFKAHIQKETNQLCIVFEVDGRQFPLFIRTEETNGLLQMLTFIPIELQPNTGPEVARLLHLLNKELDLPGFGMNEESGHVFYRLTIPCFKNKLEEKILDAFLASIQIVCKTFAVPIATVASGTVTYEDLVKKAKANMPTSTNPSN